MRHPAFGLAFLLGLPVGVQAQAPDQSWQITINLGPCEAFARGTFRPMYSGPVGTYLVGGVDGESQCTGEFADSTFEVGSGMAFAVLNQKDDELIITIDDPDGFMKLIAKGATPMGRRSGVAYLCVYPSSAEWSMWESMMQLGGALESYAQLNAAQQREVALQLGAIGLSTAMHCIKGTFSLLPS